MKPKESDINLPIEDHRLELFSGQMEDDNFNNSYNKVPKHNINYNSYTGHRATFSQYYLGIKADRNLYSVSYLCRQIHGNVVREMMRPFEETSSLTIEEIDPHEERTSRLSPMLAIENKMVENKMAENKMVDNLIHEFDEISISDSSSVTLEDYCDKDTINVDNRYKNNCDIDELCNGIKNKPIPLSSYIFGMENSRTQNEVVRSKNMVKSNWKETDEESNKKEGLKNKEFQLDEIMKIKTDFKSKSFNNMEEFKNKSDFRSKEEFQKKRKALELGMINGDKEIWKPKIHLSTQRDISKYFENRKYNNSDNMKTDYVKTIPIYNNTDDETNYNNEEINEKENINLKTENSRHKKVEFSKTEVHFVADSGKISIVATDEKPPTTKKLRRRRNSGPPFLVNESNLPLQHFGDDISNELKNNTSNNEFEIFNPSKTIFKIEDNSNNNNSNTAHYTSKINFEKNEEIKNEYDKSKSILRNKVIPPKPYILGDIGTSPFNNSNEYKLSDPPDRIRKDFENDYGSFYNNKSKFQYKDKIEEGTGKNTIQNKSYSTIVNLKYDDDMDRPKTIISTKDSDNFYKLDCSPSQPLDTDYLKNVIEKKPTERIKSPKPKNKEFIYFGTNKSTEKEVSSPVSLSPEPIQSSNNIRRINKEKYKDIQKKIRTPIYENLENRNSSLEKEKNNKPRTYIKNKTNYVNTQKKNVSSPENTSQKIHEGPPFYENINLNDSLRKKKSANMVSKDSFNEKKQKASELDSKVTKRIIEKENSIENKINYNHRPKNGGKILENENNLEKHSSDLLSKQSLKYKDKKIASRPLKEDSRRTTYETITKSTSPIIRECHKYKKENNKKDSTSKIYDSVSRSNKTPLLSDRRKIRNTKSSDASCDEISSKIHELDLKNSDIPLSKARHKSRERKDSDSPVSKARHKSRERKDIDSPVSNARQQSREREATLEDIRERKLVSEDTIKELPSLKYDTVTTPPERHKSRERKISLDETKDSSKMYDTVLKADNDQVLRDRHRSKDRKKSPEENHKDMSTKLYEIISKSGNHSVVKDRKKSKDRKIPSEDKEQPLLSDKAKIKERHRSRERKKSVERKTKEVSLKMENPVLKTHHKSREQKTSPNKPVGKVIPKTTDTNCLKTDSSSIPIIKEYSSLVGTIPKVDERDSKRHRHRSKSRHEKKTNSYSKIRSHQKGNLTEDINHENRESSKDPARRSHQKTVTHSQKRTSESKKSNIDKNKTKEKMGNLSMFRMA